MRCLSPGRGQGRSRPGPPSLVAEVKVCTQLRSYSWPPMGGVALLLERSEVMVGVPLDWEAGRVLVSWGGGEGQSPGLPVCRPPAWPGGGDGPPSGPCVGVPGWWGGLLFKDHHLTFIFGCDWAC